MRYLKKIISGGFIGIGIGFTVNLFFSFLNGEYMAGVPSFLEQYDSLLTAIAVQTLVFSCLGIIQSYASDILDNQSRNLLINTIIHFLIILLPLLGAAYLLHWSRDMLNLLSIGSSITIVYFGIWIVSYLHIKSQIEKINQTILKNSK